MGSPFKSLGAKTPKRVSFNEAETVAIAKQLLEEHATAREAATQQLNAVCGNCQGAGNVASTLMPGQTTPCWACDGTGKPNDKVQSLPELSEEDNLRIWKIGQLLKGPHRAAIVALIREQFPTMYADGPVEKAAN